MRESVASGARLLRRYFDHLAAGGSGLGFIAAEMPEMLEPPAQRPIAVSPRVYAMMQKHRRQRDFVLDADGDLAPAL